MIRTTIASAAALLLAASPAAAQDAQERLDARYDRALAAGYKALMLCSAIGHARDNGISRGPRSVEEYELSVIQSPFDEIIADLPAEIVGFPESTRVQHVLVEWADDMPPRLAHNRWGSGCALAPIGYDKVPEARERIPAPPPIVRVITPQTDGMKSVFDRGFGTGFGDGSRTTAIVVQQGNQIVAEAYVDGFTPLTPQRTWSVAKSIAATLVGVAVYRGEADVAASAGLGDNENDPRRAITIDQTLRMASGRYSDTPGNRTDALYWGGATVTEVAQTTPLINKPGTVFRYANNDTLAAVQAIDLSAEKNSPSSLFRQLNMRDTVAETDWEGNYILSSQVWSTARDLARLGQLHLDGGVLPSGERILPEGWTDYVSSPAGPQPEGRPFGYGAGWWLLNASGGVPPDTYAAMGNRGQFVVVVPSRDVVIVRRGEDPAGQGGFDIAAFTRDVLAALED